jgi:hypothetical protein
VENPGHCELLNPKLWITLVDSSRPQTLLNFNYSCQQNQAVKTTGSSKREKAGTGKIFIKLLIKKLIYSKQPLPLHCLFVDSTKSAGGPGLPAFFFIHARLRGRYLWLQPHFPISLPTETPAFYTQHMSLIGRIAGTFTFKLFGAGLNFLIVVLIARYLGPAGKGAASLLIANISVILLFTGILGG